jgi:hypothetical protein
LARTSRRYRRRTAFGLFYPEVVVPRLARSTGCRRNSRRA